MIRTPFFDDEALAPGFMRRQVKRTTLDAAAARDAAAAARDAAAAARDSAAAAQDSS